ncbi:hypothetical protein SPV1_07551 [Mariprofundus ferrooxydans PV-1]|uniref:Uncharacterized protein n=1 Tax=Mariprofundus ferrooxydans PV-1 TaxID=314345 RepID=Q0EZ92_9PROT|nr:hypothetical protein SPV1_07551 [Mariprofundus ferrooxydans PV-1]
MSDFELRLLNFGRRNPDTLLEIF